MSTTEHTINDALAAELQKTRSAWHSPDVVRSENTGMIKGSAARPDVLVLEHNVSPVVIETEVLPATTVEAEAKSRLGEEIKTTGRTILSAIAVRLPVRLRELSGNALAEEIASADDLEFALFTGSSPDEAERWPRSGWLTGGISDLSLIAQAAGVPPHVIEEAADELVSGVSEAAHLLEEIAESHPAVGSSRVDLQACKLEYSIVSPK